jgi:hypothetical protein
MPTGAVHPNKIIDLNADQTGKIGYLPTVLMPRNPRLSGFFTDDYLADCEKVIPHAKDAPSATANENPIPSRSNAACIAASVA